jgi:hypothetical protein
MDVERALMHDYTRGGLAIETRILGNGLVSPEIANPLGQHLVRVAIDYQHDHGNPFAIDGVTGPGFGTFPITPAAKDGTDSAREQIVADLQTTLQGVTTANGYQNTLVEVVREPRSPEHAQAYPFATLLEINERKQEGGELSPYGLLGCLLDCVVVVWAREPHDSEKLAPEANELLADVKRALMVDKTRGGLAITTRMLGNEPDTDETGLPFGTHSARVQVWYRHSRTDPTLVG